MSQVSQPQLPNFDPSPERINRLNTYTRGAGLTIASVMCAAGAIVVMLPGTWPDGYFWMNLSLGFVLFLLGLMVAHVSVEEQVYELHFDPERGEFFVLGDKDELSDAVVLAKSENAKIDVNGRHCQIVDEISRNTLSVSLDDPILAMAVAENYRKYTNT